METIEIDGDDIGAEMAKFWSATETMEVIRRGKTVGYFFPTPPPTEEEINATREAHRTFELQMAEQNIDPDELIAEFDKLRKRAKGSRKPRGKSA